MKKRMVKSAEQMAEVEVIQDSEVAVRVDVKETRTTSVKLEDLLDFRLSAGNVVATLRNDVGRFKRGHAFAKLLKREYNIGEGDAKAKATGYLVVPFMFAAPSVDDATGVNIDAFAPSFLLKNRVSVRRFLAGTYRKLTDLEGVSPVFVDAGEVNPAPVEA